MDGHSSLKRLASLVGAIVSLLAIMSFYVPFAKLSMDLGDLWAGGKEYTVFEMFKNGTGKVIAVFGTFLLVANTILQFLKPKAWLNLVCTAFLFIPIMLASSGNVQFIHKEIGWWLCLIFGIILIFVWLIGYCYYVRTIKNVRRMTIWGGALTIIAVLVPLAIPFMVLPSLVILLPVGFCLLFTSLLGRIFSKRGSENNHIPDTDGLSDVIQIDTTQPRWKNYLWTIVCGTAFVLAVVVFLICIGGDKQTEEEKLEDVVAQMKSISYEESKDIQDENVQMTIEETQEYELTEEDADDDWDATTSIDWEGTINGKWKIEMTVHRLDGMVWGSYRYTKNKSDIPLDGQWGEDNQLTLTENVDGNITGQFIGTYGEDSFDGTWVSADGEKEYPFTLKPIYKAEP